jgi:tetratricopeptide (TPR) repeat protein
MTRLALAALAALTGISALLAAAPAQSAMTVFSDTAQDCYRDAKYGDFRGNGVDDCDSALFGMSPSNRDYAGTLVNRGVVYLWHGRYNRAVEDFDSAIAVNPNVGEAYVNRGAARIALRQYTQGIADIDRGLPLGSEEPEKAYYNRGLAHEGLDDETAAYHDYMKAAELKPAWAAPKLELTRFTVHER